MLGCGRLVILFLLIKLLNLSFVSSTSSSSHGRSDYDVYEDPTTEPPSSSSTVSEVPNSFCDYNLCVEHQKTCQELADVTGCLCPGLSSAFIPPSPPRLLNLTQDGKGVVVRWCAPTSVVTYYIVWLKGNGTVIDRKISVEENKRKAVLENVEVGAHICVKAVNKAGNSTEDDQSCATFKPKPDSGFALKMGIIGGVVGLILLLILALLLWRHKTRQKSTAQPGGVL